MASSDAPPSDPTDANASQVYADWLQSQGDPRGELIIVQHLRTTADTPALAAREGQLLAKLRAPLFGSLSPLLEPGAGLEVTWQRGFLKRARLSQDRYDSELEVEAALRELLGLPIAEHLEEVVIGVCGSVEDGDYSQQPAIDVLLALKPKSVKHLVLGEIDSRIDISAANLGDLTGLSDALPQLESLKLHGFDPTLGAMRFEHLREFTLETGGLSCIDDLHRARWPMLERLVLWFGDNPDYGAETELADLEPLFEGDGLRTLRHLGLMNCGFLTGNIDRLANAKVVSQLETLDLSMGTLSDEDAEAFVRHGAKLAHLQRLDVDDNYFSKRGLYLLQKVVANVGSKGQRGRFADEDRYASVGE